MSKDLLVKGLIFLTGAAIGSVVTWKVVKTKYEQIANEEIESVKETFSNRGKRIEMNPVDEAAAAYTSNMSTEEIRDMVQKLGYLNDEIMKKKEEDEEDMDYRPEVIAPEESWEQDYPTISLTYYEGDGVLTDDRNRPIKNVDELVGDDFASHFGEYEDDSVFIRNDKTKAYYEILRDYGSFSDLDGD